MNRKKWTAKAEVTESLLKFREKRKWQLALRRYILEKNPSQAYARYFGLGITEIRKWIELQFTEGLTWDNFGDSWQLDHIVPVAYFDFSEEEDLLLCWNFINIRVEKIELDKTGSKKIDVLAAKLYFESIYKNTGYSRCLKMVEKINAIELSNIVGDPALEDFLIRHKEYLETISSLDRDEFNRLNQGMGLKDILLEKEILKKFG